MRSMTRRSTLTLLAAAAATPAWSERLYLDGMGHAIRGYDPVAYFESEEARRGSFDLAWETKDGIWLFSRAAFRDLFIADPQKYMPQFGGFDAEGMARGFKRRSDPELWVMIERKIYLHYSIIDQNRWAEDIWGNIRLGEENWKALRDI